MNKICKCKKCGKTNCKLTNTLCLQCYNKYSYQRAKHNLSLEDFIKGNIKFYQKEAHPYTISLQTFEHDYVNLIKSKKQKINAYCKEHQISRQTFYNMKKLLENFVKTLDKNNEM